MGSRAPFRRRSFRHFRLHSAVDALVTEEVAEQRVMNLHANVQGAIGFLPFADEWPALQPIWKRDSKKSEREPLARRDHDDLIAFNAWAKLDLEQAPAAAPIDDRTILLIEMHHCVELSL